MNVLSVAQCTKPKFKDIQSIQKIAWITGISVSIILNIVLAVLCGLWNNERLTLKTDKKSLQNDFNQCQNDLYYCEYTSQKTCNNTVYKAGDKVVLFKFSQNIQPSNLNNITDTIEIKDNGDIYINDKEATTETCKTLPQEIYLLNNDNNNYYTYDISNFVKEIPTEIPEEEENINNLNNLNNLNQIITKVGTVNSKYTDNLILQLNNIQIYPLNEIYTTFNNEIIQIKPSNEILYDKPFNKVLQLNNNNTISFNDKQIYPIDENVLGNQIYVTNNKYTTYGPGDYSLTVADGEITKDNIYIYPFKDTIYTSINGNNYMIQTPSNEQFQWTQLDNPTEIKFLENGTITINDKEATTETCKILPQEIYIQKEDKYYTYNITNFIKETPTEGNLQGTLNSDYTNNLVLQLDNKQIYPIDEDVLGNQIYVSNNKYTTYGPGDYSLTVAGGNIIKDDIQIYPLNEIYTTFNNEIIQIKPSNEILYNKSFSKVLQLNNNNTISFNDKQIYPIDEDVLGNQIYVSNNKYTTYGPGDYSLSVENGNIIKDDIQIYPLKNTVYFEANNTWYSVKGPSKVLSYNPVKKDDKLNGALEIGGSTNPALTIKGIWGNEQSATSIIYINNIAEGENIQQTSLLGKGCKVNNLGVCLSPANGTTVMNFYNITYRTTPNGTETEDIESKKLYMITLPNDKHIQPTNDTIQLDEQPDAENYGGTINIEPGVKVTLSGTYGNNKLTPSGGVINLDQVNLITSNQDTTKAIYYKPTTVSAQCNIYDDTLQMCINPLPSTIYSQDENGENIYKVSLPNNVVYKPQQETIQGEIILNKNYQISLSKKFGSETQTPAVSILTNELITSSCKVEIDGLCFINKDNKLLNTFYSSFDNYDYQLHLPQQLYIKPQAQKLTGVLDFNYNGQITLQSGQFGSSRLTPTIDIKDGVKLLSSECQIMNGTSCIDSSNKISFKYTKDNINYYYTLSGPQEKIYQGDIPVNSSQTDIISSVELGNNKQLTIYGSFGENTPALNTGINITPVQVWGKLNSILIDNTQGTLHGQVNINTNIESSSQGIMIGSNISFKNCQNGIYIDGKVNGSNSGILINADIGHIGDENDKNSLYGIRQSSGTIQGTFYGFYQQGTINSNNGILIQGTVTGKTSAIQITGTVGDENSKYGIYQNPSSTIQGTTYGIYTGGTVIGSNSGIYIDGGTIGHIGGENDTNSTYGIYQNAGTIQGTLSGFYQQGSISGGTYGIQLKGTVKGSDSGILIQGTIGDVNTKFGIQQSSGKIQGSQIGFYQYSQTPAITGGSTGISVSGVITAKTNGITINKGVQFKDCSNGISINGNVKGKNSGIYLNGDIGHIGGKDDINSTYGIYQTAGTIQGTNTGIYQTSGSINGNTNGIYIGGTIGHIGKENETNTTYGIYQKSGTIYGTTSGICVNGTIQGNSTNSSNGILINSSAQFENYYNGINVNGTVKGSNSGVYVNATVGHIGKENETNSTYGIYQNTGTIYGTTSGIQLKGTIQGNNTNSSNGIMIQDSAQFKNYQNGISINGKVSGSDNGIYISGTVGDENTQTGIHVDGNVKGSYTGIYQNTGSIQGNNYGIYVNGKIQGNDINTSTGIMIDQNVSFQDCSNGIYTLGKVNGSKSGIYIAGDIGHIGGEDDVNSQYGIYQNSGTIKGQYMSIYMDGNVGDNKLSQYGIYLSGNSKVSSSINGVQIDGTVTGSNSGIYIAGGTIGYIGKENETNSTYGIYQESGTIYGTTNGIQLKGTIQGNNTNSSNGIYIDQGVSFENYKNGIFTNGTVKGENSGININATICDVNTNKYGIFVNGDVIGTDSGIYVNATIGDYNNTIYGIYQNTSTIQGEQIGFYQSGGYIYGRNNGIQLNGNIQGDVNGISINDKVIGLNSGVMINNGNIQGTINGIQIKGTVKGNINSINIDSSSTLTAPECKVKNGNTCLLNP